MEVGSCYGRSLRWAYDMQFRRCRPFFFSGCNGNQNNFRSKLSCELACPGEYVMVANDINESISPSSGPL
ncbi:WAP, Kazal, immunoglobulin, Kunitz and NTR domain-containing protein 1 [Holothuria leucospilota]|uniref:WAP, Kazal, immunoglobulin, Kunitz and NTR domain-containing protein 1 n=1 Tax=Holothuria leucospilota TaxID=206669 RepID=A0A9Q1C0V7_HOLLE|nr:WAP, Kazal, immunoglobulin, Kunitz and NTR domain-containing protein 1 [Holothuria leucospilota]